MYKRQMKQYSLEIPHMINDEYNQSITTYEFDRTIDMALSVDSIKLYNNNQTDVINTEMIGLSKDPYINKGDRIDKKYIVTFVEPNRLYTIVHLKEIDNDGRF